MRDTKGRFITGHSYNVKGKLIYLGMFKDKKDAALAYNFAAIKYHGEFACLNQL